MLSICVVFFTTGAAALQALFSPTMDEQKIQLESRNDYEYVRSQFLTHLKGLKDCGKFSMEEIDMVFTRAHVGAIFNILVHR